MYHQRQVVGQCEKEYCVVASLSKSESFQALVEWVNSGPELQVQFELHCKC